MKNHWEALGLSVIDDDLDSRAISFENPAGSRGGGGTTGRGRKGSPSRVLSPGEKLVLADLEGPGTLRHIWMTIPPAPPEVMRALWMDVYYEGLDAPSVSVPCLDFFSLPHGRPVEYYSALQSVHEGRGFNSYVPMPFRNHLRVEVTNSSQEAIRLYFQIDYTLEKQLPAGSGLLHALFCRENPTVMGRDFVVVQGLEGPGRFLGCNVGIRVLDSGLWYGEGEVKIFRDGDREYPTICGTGLEDYVGSAWGLGVHHGPYAGAPLIVSPPAADVFPPPPPDFVGLYRWHLLDPIVFESDLRVTIQQIGAAFFLEGQQNEFEEYAGTHPAAGDGWSRNVAPGVIAEGIVERADDYCSTAFVYCLEPQPVPKVENMAAIQDIGRRNYEQASRLEQILQTMGPGSEETSKRSPLT